MSDVIDNTATLADLVEKYFPVLAKTGATGFKGAQPGHTLSDLLRDPLKKWPMFQTGSLIDFVSMAMAHSVTGQCSLPKSLPYNCNYGYGSLEAHAAITLLQMLVADHRTFHDSTAAGLRIRDVAKNTLIQIGQRLLQDVDGLLHSSKLVPCHQKCRDNNAKATVEGILALAWWLQDLEHHDFKFLPFFDPEPFDELPKDSPHYDGSIFAAAMRDALDEFQSATWQDLQLFRCPREFFKDKTYTSNILREIHEARTAEFRRARAQEKMKKEEEDFQARLPKKSERKTLTVRKRKSPSQESLQDSKRAATAQ